MINLLVVETPPMIQAWLFFSFLIPILLLLRIEGAVYVVWLLPVVTLAYLIDNQFYEKPAKPSSDAALFPSEKIILERYVKEPLDSNIFKQEDQLKKGWQLYLIDEWAQEKPSANSNEARLQAENGEFAFNVERLRRMDIKEDRFWHRESIWILGLYLVWNALFAFIVFRFCHGEK